MKQTPEQLRLKKRARWKKWYHKNIARNRTKANEYQKKWRKKNLEKVRGKKRVWEKEYRKKLRLDILNAYSNNDPKCACCGESNLGFLTIDHIDDNGAEHRRSISKSGRRCGWGLNQWLRRNNYPKGFQILCFNCNCGKHIYRKCPHMLE